LGKFCLACGYGKTALFVPTPHSASQLRGGYIAGFPLPSLLLCSLQAISIIFSSLFILTFFVA
jgi:hypothetical protein